MTTTMTLLYRLTKHPYSITVRSFAHSHGNLSRQHKTTTLVDSDQSNISTTQSSIRSVRVNQSVASCTSQLLRSSSILQTLLSPKFENYLHSVNMTNKPRYLSSATKSCDVVNGSQTESKRPDQAQPFKLIDNINFKTMASVQKMAIEPTREHIENIKEILKHRNAKNNDDQEVTLEKDQDSGIATVRIKSAAKNGISAKMMCDFLDVIDQLYAWPQGKGVLIYGHNGFFCSGGDLISVRELANYEDGLKMATLMQYNLSRLQSLPMITMALIQGKALGGGAEIAVTSDLRVMTKSSKLGYVHCRVGIVAAWGGGSRLVQLIGPSRAVELMSSGRLVGPDEALNIGLVNSVIDDANMDDKQVIEEAKKYLKSHLIGANSTIVAIKALVNAARTLPLEQALVVEGQILSSTWGKGPHMEALNNNVKHRGDA